MNQIVLTDQAGREVKLSSPPSRIVCLVPSITQLICALGLDDHLVGVTRFCEYPQDIKKRKVVTGGTKKVHFDRVRKLNPDLVLCNKEENTEAIVNELASFTQVHVSDIKTLDDYSELLKQYGRLFSVEPRVEVLQEKLTRVLDDDLLQGLRPVKAAYFIWKDPWMLAGENTFVDHMLKWGKFENVVRDHSRYPAFERDWPEQWERPEWVLLSSEPYPFKEKHLEEVRALLPEAKIVLVDGQWFSWYGPMLPDFMRLIARFRRQNL